MLTTIATFTEPWEAHLFAGRLRAEGCAATVAHEHHIWNNWPIATALRGVKVQVPEHEAEAARAIWRACRDGEYRDMFAEEFGDEAGSFKCPKCGSREIRSWHTWLEIAFAWAATFGLGALVRAWPSGYRCKQCGERWGVGNLNSAK